MQKHADRTDKRPPIIAGPTGSMAQDLYWPKMDPSLYQGHDRLDPYGQGLMDPTRFHQQFAEDLRHQGPYGMGGGGWGDPSKASSAFSPINTGVLPTSTGFNMGSGTRGYPFYDPISFQRQSQVNKYSHQGVIRVINMSSFVLRLGLSLKPRDPTWSPSLRSRTTLTTEEVQHHDAVWSRLTANHHLHESPILTSSAFKFPENQNSQDWRRWGGLAAAATILTSTIAVQHYTGSKPSWRSPGTGSRTWALTWAQTRGRLPGCDNRTNIC